MTTFPEVLQSEVADLQTRHPILKGVLDKAYTLLMNGHVFMLEDGVSAHVQSESQADVSYLTNGSCDCASTQYRTAPCKHRYALRLYQRACARLLEDETERWEPVPGDLTATDTAPLPEAPASVNVRVHIAGREVQWTLRDHDEARLATRLEALLARYPLPEAPQAPPAQGKAGEWCRAHGVAMRWNEGKDGRKGWYSHRTDGGWCQGK